MRIITFLCDNSSAWCPQDFADMYASMLCSCGSDCLCDHSKGACCCSKCTKGWEFSKCFLDSGDALPVFEDYDAFIISGSRHNVRDSASLAWFEPLCDFVRRIRDMKGKALIGICFGSQIVAHALGGEVDRNQSGEFILLAETINFDHKVLAKLPEVSQCCQSLRSIGDAGEEGQIKIINSHGDSCIKLPPCATRLASSQSCDNEVYVCGRNILCCQGHPEFELNYAIWDRIWPAVVEKNQRLSEEKILAARASFEGYTQPFNTIALLIAEFITIVVTKEEH